MEDIDDDEIIESDEGEEEKEEESKAGTKKYESRPKWQVGQILIALGEETQRYKFFQIVFITKLGSLKVHELAKKQHVTVSDAKEHTAEVSPDLSSVKESYEDGELITVLWRRAKSEYSLFINQVKYVLENYNPEQKYIERTLWDGFMLKDDKRLEGILPPTIENLRSVYKWMRVGKDKYIPETSSANNLSKLPSKSYDPDLP